MKLLFLDTETTGNVPGQDRLISVAYKAGDALVHELFAPTCEISLEAMSTHHITPAMVADRPPFVGSEMYQQLQRLLEDHVLVAHNAAFDIAMLEAEGLTVPQFICTLKVARALDGEARIPQYKLQYLRYYWQLPVGTGEEAVAHSADGDVLVLEALFNHLLSQVVTSTEDKVKAITTMLELSTQPTVIRQLPFGKYRGRHLQDIAREDPGYLEWLLREKEKAIADGTGRSDDRDFVYSIKQALGQAVSSS